MLGAGTTWEFVRFDEYHEAAVAFTTTWIPLALADLGIRAVPFLEAIIALALVVPLISRHGGWACASLLVAARSMPHLLTRNAVPLSLALVVALTQPGGPRGGHGKGGCSTSKNEAARARGLK